MQTDKIVTMLSYADGFQKTIYGWKVKYNFRHNNQRPVEILIWFAPLELIKFLSSHVHPSNGVCVVEGVN